MTRPVTAAATLLLVEEGKLALHEPVDRLLPELAERRVLRQRPSSCAPWDHRRRRRRTNRMSGSGGWDPCR